MFAIFLYAGRHFIVCILRSFVEFAAPHPSLEVSECLVVLGFHRVNGSERPLWNPKVTARDGMVAKALALAQATATAPNSSNGCHLSLRLSVWPDCALHQNWVWIKVHLFDIWEINYIFFYNHHDIKKHAPREVFSSFDIFPQSLSSTLDGN